MGYDHYAPTDYAVLHPPSQGRALDGLRDPGCYPDVRKVRPALAGCYPPCKADSARVGVSDRVGSHGGSLNGH